MTLLVCAFNTYSMTIVSSLAKSYGAVAMVVWLVRSEWLLYIIIEGGEGRGGEEGKPLL